MRLSQGHATTSRPTHCWVSRMIGKKKPTFSLGCDDFSATSPGSEARSSATVNFVAPLPLILLLQGGGIFHWVCLSPSSHQAAAASWTACGTKYSAAVDYFASLLFVLLLLLIFLDVCNNRLPPYCIKKQLSFQRSRDDSNIIEKPAEMHRF